MYQLMVINQSVNQSSMTCIKHTTPPLTLAGGGASRDDCIEVWGWFVQGSDLHLGLYSSLTSANNLNLLTLLTIFKLVQV